MALPVLNETPKYELTIPSSGKTVRYRPYLVKEEKIMMVAMESNDPNQFIRATYDTVNACCEGDLGHLTTFDLEYIFLQLRSKSVGETVQMTLNCRECESPNEVSINLDEIKCDVDTVISNLIKLDDKTEAKLRYPSYENLDMTENESEMGFRLMANALEHVIHDGERIEVAEESEENVYKFIESLTSKQFEKLSEFIHTIPKVEHDVKYTCQKCGSNEKVHLEGLVSFF